MLQCSRYIFSKLSLFQQFILISDMVRTRGGSRVRPRVRFSTPEREAAALVPAPVPSPVPEAVLDEPLGFRRYQTRMGPRTPSPVPRRSCLADQEAYVRREPHSEEHATT